MCVDCSHDVKKCKSRELRGSILYTSCDCIKRNGLQDSCPRSECQGASACMNMPEPSCCPAKHAQRYINMRVNIGKTKQKCAEEPNCPRLGAGSDGDGPQYNVDKKVASKECIQEELIECKSKS